MIEAKNIFLGYDKNVVLKDISFKLCKNAITTIIGPNGCGKSTLLKAMVRCLKPFEGEIRFKDTPINQINTKELAKDIALLPQSPQIPSDYTVYDLVCQGRFPYTGWTGRLSRRDHDIVAWAMKATHIEDLCDRIFSTLSGGEKQRACMAMALAQQPKVLFLDEPTTHLDIAHQFEVLELIKQLNETMGLSIIMVLHDLNHAVKYSHYIMVMNEHKIYAYGEAKQIIREQLCEDVFGINVRFVQDDVGKSRLVIPVGAKGEIR